MNKNASLVGFALALAAVLMWGGQFTVAKSAYRAVDVLQSSVFRYGVPTVILCALLLAKEGWRAFDYGGRARLSWTIGLIGMTGSPLLVFGGLTMTRPETVAIIVATQPTMAALAEWVLRGRRPSRFTLACIIVAFLGVLTVVTRWSVALAPSGTELLGDVMALFGAACWVVYTMMIERFSGWSSLRMTTLTMIPGAVGTVVVCALAFQLGWIHSIDTSLWLSIGWQLLYLALIGVLAAMICWNMAARRLGTLNVVLFLNLIPVVTYLIRFIDGQVFAPIELVGGAMVVSSLIANNLYQRNQLIKARRLAATDAATDARAAVA